MDITDPRIDPRLVPEGSQAIVIADQHQRFLELPSVLTPNGQVITRWAPTEDERRAILLGEDIFVTLLSHGQINAFFVTVGPVDWKDTRC